MTVTKRPTFLGHCGKENTHMNIIEENPLHTYENRYLEITTFNGLAGYGQIRIGIRFDTYLFFLLNLSMYVMFLEIYILYFFTET
jgi:hypothetical protein